MAVLILSSPEDMHAVAVGEKLDQLSVKHYLFSFTQFPSVAGLSYTLSDGDSLGRIKTAENKEVDLRDLESIWYRRPGRVRSPSMPDSWVERMIETESTAAMGGFMRNSGCLMVNHPGKDSESLIKLWQLECARQAGLTIPDTIVTNEPAEALEFCNKRNGQVIYKLISEGTNFQFPAFEYPVGIPTMSLKEQDLEHFEQIKYAPHLFQAKVEKRHEVRATVVGECIFAARIDSQAGKAKTDWRLDYTVPMDACELPDDIAEKSLQLMRKLGLNYAAFDFIVDIDGKYVFLELNCAGQYLWLENRTGQPISMELARLLSGKSKPLVAPDRSGVQA